MDLQELLAYNLILVHRPAGLTFGMVKSEF